MTQQERKKRRENELKQTIKEIKKNHFGVCDHCHNNDATDIAHNLPRRKCGYKYYSNRNNLMYICRSCHSLLDGWNIFKFARLNMYNFFVLQTFLWEINEPESRALFFCRMDKFMEQSIE